MIVRTNFKNQTQKGIYAEYIRIFQKLNDKLTSLSNKIKEQVLNVAGKLIMTQMRVREKWLRSTNSWVWVSSKWPHAQKMWLRRPKTKFWIRWSCSCTTMTSSTMSSSSNLEIGKHSWTKNMWSLKNLRKLIYLPLRNWTKTGRLKAKLWLK